MRIAQSDIKANTRRPAENVKMTDEFSKGPVGTGKLAGNKERTMQTIKRILRVEDDPKDIELTLTELSEYNPANDTAVARDGVEALDYLYRRGTFAQ